MQRLSIAILATVAAAALATGASADTVTLFPSADSFLRAGTGDDLNAGTEVYLRIQSQAVNRAVLRFDQAAIQSAVGAGTLQKAVLLLFVESTGSWDSGRNVDLHRLNTNWTEAGVTWNCPVAGCVTQWGGGDFNPIPTGTVLHTNDLTGNFIQFDVTADVAAFLASTPNYGWLVKKTGENQDGHARYTSRHGVGSQLPRLVLSYTAGPPTAAVCDGAAPGNPCVPGGGARASDCVFEWQTKPVPPLQPNGVPKRKITCWEGDATCDSDANITNKSCTFRLTGCINNADPRLPTCNNAVLSRWEVKKPSPLRAESLIDGANLAALEGLAAGGFGATVVRRGDTVVHVGSPNASPNRCSNFFDFVVPMKVRPSGTRKQTSRIRVRAMTADAAIDTDSLLLECRPSTCGNNIVEADHEECDDGNRIDGDNCNRGCRFEGPTPTPTLTRTVTFTKTQTGTPTPIGPTSTITLTPTVTPTHTQSLCGNNSLDGGEQCDDGAACFGGSNEGSPCTNNAQCPGGGECRAAGGDGCAVNCTNETSVVFELTGAVCKGGSTDGDSCSFQSTCVGGVVARPCTTQSDCSSVGGTCTSECGASPSRGCFANGECTAGTNLGAQCYVFPSGTGAGTCNGGGSNGLPCSTTADCGGSPCDNPCGAGAPAGACQPRSRASLGGTGFIVNVGPLIGAEELRLGGPDANGLIPVASPANSATFNPVSVPGLACVCVRGVPDPGMHGPNNSASGTIACGATPIANDVSIAIDHNTYPPQTCFIGPNTGMPCHNRCSAGGTRAGLPCAVTGTNATECPGGTTNAHRQCNSIPDCGVLNACNATNGPGICLDGDVPGRACLDNTQCLGGTCMGRCTAGTVVGALCGCETGNVCPNPGDCGTDGVCRVAGGQGGGFCAGPPRFCQGGSKAGFACYDPDECPGGTCPATGNFLGYCESDADCPGSACASVDDSTACALTDPSPPNGSGDAACLETFEFCTAGPNLGADCSTAPAGDANCGSGGECGSACSARPSHIGLCNSPTRTRFSGAGGMGSALLLSTMQVGTISDGGSCATEKQCAGGGNDGAACQVNEDCPGGACASAICHGFCSIATTTPCLVNADCPSGGGVCNPGAMFDVPCPGTTPETECGANAVCRGVSPAKGFDGIPCTSDDPPLSQGVVSTIPQTTGTSNASVSDSFAGASSGQQLVHKSCYPSALPTTNCITSSSGTLFNCSSLLSMSPSATGVRLTTAVPNVDGIKGDAAIVTLLVAR